MSEPLLRIADIVIEFLSEGRISRAVDGVDLEVHAGETVGLVGETGCGKSVTALSILGLVPHPPGRVRGGQILFEGEDLLQKTPSELRRIRGLGISMIFQEPMTSLDPSFTVESQMAEVISAHRGLSRDAARSESLSMLERMRMPHPERVLRQYPFELSGGMRQRVMIGMALSCRPKLIIADEPTTALDVTVQAQILALLGDLKREMGTALLLITHDMGVVAETCDRVYVMYAGRVVESAAVADLFREPLHPYTKALLQAIPSLGTAAQHLAMIPGDVPSPTQYPPGCRFAPRCQYAMPVCVGEVPPITAPKTDHRVACYLY